MKKIEEVNNDEDETIQEIGDIELVESEDGSERNTVSYSITSYQDSMNVTNNFCRITPLYSDYEKKDLSYSKKSLLKEFSSKKVLKSDVIKPPYIFLTSRLSVSRAMAL